MSGEERIYESAVRVREDKKTRFLRCADEVVRGINAKRSGSFVPSQIKG